MKGFISLSLLCSLALGAEINLDTVTVEESIDSVKVNDVSGEELKSADLGEALSKKLPFVEISRRSAIANDIIVRGQKRDNINVIIDGGKIYGGCPNRMDPPISHVVTNNIDYVEVDEGPYDVENFGTLSADVKVYTKNPKKGLNGEINLNAGRFDYKKGSFTLSGGSEDIRALISFSKEDSGQYKDADGDKFQDQLIKAGTDKKYLYQNRYEDMDAFSKKSFLGKLFLRKDKHSIVFSYTANRSDDVLYPNTPMDAKKDDSDLYNVKYSIDNLGSFSKKLEVLYYYSKVKHPMSNFYRNSSLGKMGEVVNDMFSRIYGARVKNSLILNGLALDFGVDASDRKWDGTYYKKSSVFWRKSINDSVTKDKALFLVMKKDISNHNLKIGVRYDSVDISNGGGLNEPSYNYLSANIFDTYKLNQNTNLFFGIGRASRVPDGRELYFVEKTKGVIIGTPDLKKVSNTEVDGGILRDFENGSMKLKAFYSRLSNYIYFDLKRPSHKFVNIDAKVYGLEFSGSYLAKDNLALEYGVSYLKGRKDEPLPGQRDRDLADITPFKIRVAANYIYDDTLDFTVETIARDRWKAFDSDNGESELAGYVLINIKANKEINDKIRLTFGVDNLLNRKYASSNTYNDLTLVVTGGKRKVKLFDPGRYLYLNVNYSF